LSLDDADFQRRFGGLERLYGVGGAAAIYSAHVAVVGIGGVGSWAAEALARSGVGQLTLIDLDHVAESNINRQIQAQSSTVGQAKVLAMQVRIAQINPTCQVTGIEEFVEPANWPQILPSGVTAVIDACDQMKAKLAMAAWARANRSVVFVSCGAAGGKRAAQRVELEDVSDTTHDPLLAQLRYRLRKLGAPAKGQMGVPCVFSREAVAPPDPSCAIQDGGDGSLNCHGYGSSVSVTATFGLCAAGYVMDELARRAPKPDAEQLKRPLGSPHGT
jgi:tRNA threonylcarbamoyladenosine dehydratase